MTRDQAARLLASLHGNWPNTPIDDAVTLTWYGSAFEQCDFEVGLTVVLRLVEAEERFPTIARFHEMRRAVERRNAEGTEPKQLLADTAPSASRRSVKIARLIRAETPGWGTLDDPQRGGERVHHAGAEPGPCAFCMERFSLSDEQLDRRLRIAGAA